MTRRERADMTTGAQIDDPSPCYNLCPRGDLNPHAP